jgi:hypothetical protein
MSLIILKFKVYAYRTSPNTVVKTLISTLDFITKGISHLQLYVANENGSLCFIIHNGRVYVNTTKPSLPFHVLYTK